MSKKTLGKLIYGKLGELIEGLSGRLIPRDKLPVILATLDAIIWQAFDDEEESGERRYSPDARVSYPKPEHPLTAENEEYLFVWLPAFWAWREMLTPHDFQTLNSERVVMSELS